MVQNDLSRLERRLGYHFKNRAYLKHALTHCSFSQENNERLEFLGDSILSFVIAYALVKQFPQQTEGELSRLRAFLVKGTMLAELALELQLGDYIYLGQGELKSGGFRRASILADALEAVIAAVFLDGGIEAAEVLILHVYKSRLADQSLKKNLKDSKTQLQEWLQARKQSLPEYHLITMVEENAEQIFTIQCSVAHVKEVTQGIATNRRQAEQQAAEAMLKRLNRR